jgi:hypothetical protein
MYGKDLAAVNAVTGISLLPATGSNRVLFVIALSLLASGVVVFAAATLSARKKSQSETN